MPAILPLSAHEIALDLDEDNVAADADNVLPGQHIILLPAKKAEEAARYILGEMGIDE